MWNHKKQGNKINFDREKTSKEKIKDKLKKDNLTQDEINQLVLDIAKEFLSDLSSSYY